MIAAMAKAPLPRFTESAINELFTARIFLKVTKQDLSENLAKIFALQANRYIELIM